MSYVAFSIRSIDISFALRNFSTFVLAPYTAFKLCIFKIWLNLQFDIKDYCFLSVLER